MYLLFGEKARKRRGGLHIAIDRSRCAATVKPARGADTAPEKKSYFSSVIETPRCSPSRASRVTSRIFVPLEIPAAAFSPNSLIPKSNRTPREVAKSLNWCRAVVVTLSTVEYATARANTTFTAYIGFRGMVGSY